MRIHCCWCGQSSSMPIKKVVPRDDANTFVFEFLFYANTIELMGTVPVLFNDVLPLYLTFASNDLLHTDAKHLRPAFDKAFLVRLH